MFPPLRVVWALKRIQLYLLGFLPQRFRPCEGL